MGGSTMEMHSRSWHWDYVGQLQRPRTAKQRGVTMRRVARPASAPSVPRANAAAAAAAATTQSWGFARCGLYLPPTCAALLAYAPCCTPACLLMLRWLVVVGAGHPAVSRYVRPPDRRAASRCAPTRASRGRAPQGPSAPPRRTSGCLAGGTVV
jgi:hypothetical protein